MLPTTTRSGAYFRVYDPHWTDPPTETSYSFRLGGRWNPAGKFGALYLNGSLQVAAAQARFQFRNRAIKLFDLLPSERPMLAEFNVAPAVVVDAVSDAALRRLRLPARFPFKVEHATTQRIAVRANAEGLAGVATRSNAEATATATVGEELALFDTHPLPPQVGDGVFFATWYSDPVPGVQ